MKNVIRPLISITFLLLVCFFISPKSAVGQTTTLDIKVFFQGYWNGTVHSVVPVSVEVRSGGATPNSSVLVERQIGLMSTNGTIQLPFSTLTTGSYWVILRCGGRLPVSSTLQTITGGTTFSYDFTNALGKSFTSSSVRQFGSDFVVRSGDLDGNETVNSVDALNYYIPNNGKSVFGTIPPP